MGTFAGFVSGGRSRAAGPDRGHVLGALAALSHPGLGSPVAWEDPDAGLCLAHRPGASSPDGPESLVSADGRWAMVFDGIVFNRNELDRLSGAAPSSQDASGARAVLESIARRGLEATLETINGAFALALWDRNERVLAVARDRVGEKPLWYGWTETGFVFASELASLRRLPGVGGSPDRTAIAEFLRFGFVPEPLSIVPGVSKLPPGTLLRVRPGEAAAEPEAYWLLRDVAAEGIRNPLEGSDEEVTSLFEDALREAVTARLDADASLGVYLSGGVDSSTVTAVAQALSGSPLRTFTIAVGGWGDETDAASAVAGHLGTRHQVLPLPELDAVELAMRVTEVYEEPYADPSAMPTTLLCALTSEHLTVGLGGDGADELFAGYNRYKVAHGGLSKLRRLPGPARNALASGLRAVSPSGWDSFGRVIPGRAPALGTKLHKLAGALRAEDAQGAYEALAVQWNPATLMVDPPAEVSAGPADDVEAFEGFDLETMMLVDQLRTLPDNMCVKTERAGTTSGVGVRAPFLDHRLVELSWRLPQRMKVRDGQGKWIVRRVLDRHVPSELWNRPKIGFDPPLADWLRGPLKAWAGDLLSPERLRRQGLIAPEPAAVALEEHLSGRFNHDYRLWTLLMLQAWLDRNGE